MMDYQRELELTRELGELRRAYSLLDESEENVQRGIRIKEILEELGMDKGKPRASRRPTRIRYR